MLFQKGLCRRGVCVCACRYVQVGSCVCFCTHVSIWVGVCWIPTQTPSSNLNRPHTSSPPPTIRRLLFRLDAGLRARARVRARVCLCESVGMRVRLWVCGCVCVRLLDPPSNLNSSPFNRTPTLQPPPGEASGPGVMQQAVKLAVALRRQFVEYMSHARAPMPPHECAWVPSSKLF